MYSFLAAGPHSPVWVILGPKLFFVTGLVIFVTAVARLVCPDLLGQCLSRSANNNFGPSRIFMYALNVTLCNWINITRSHVNKIEIVNGYFFKEWMIFVVHGFR